MAEQHPERSVRQSMANLGQPLPWGEKARLLIRNLAIRAKTGSTCCGHPGEPGC